MTTSQPKAGVAFQLLAEGFLGDSKHLLATNVFLQCVLPSYI